MRATHLFTCVILLFAPLTGAVADETSEPNFIVFLTDDLGWGDLACYGHPVIKSPHLDRFAAEGLRLTQCYAACSVCSPSRSAILTGRTPYRNGVWRWIPQGSQYHLRESEITIATLLKKRGYETCHTGKWHLNGKFNSDEQPQPDDHGYDHWLATQNGTLEIVLVGGFLPVVGDEFEILTYGSRVGTFSTVLGTNLSNGNTLELQFDLIRLLLVTM